MQTYSDKDNSPVKGSHRDSNRIAEYSQPHDSYYDYCLWEYEPLCSGNNKLRSINILNKSFQLAGHTSHMRDLCYTLRDSIGPFKTVWGIKTDGTELFWELYFYDYKRLERTISIPRIVRAIQPFIGCDITFDESKPYFMFSLDMHPSIMNRKNKLEKINVYLGNPGSSVSSGISYELTEDSLLFENLYYFYRATDRDDIRGKIACSAHVNLNQLRIRDIMWPELVNCHCIVVANKRNNDGIYFSRITIGQLIFFLHKLSYPNALITYIEEHRALYDHLCFDVGFDYSMTGSTVQIIKGSFYGVF